MTHLVGLFTGVFSRVCARARARARARAVLAALACLGAAPVLAAADAQLWGFVDAQGVAHFASTALDSRFRPVSAPATAGAPAVIGKRHTPEGLLRWLAIAPQVRAMQPLLREAAHAHGLDPELLVAVVAVESGFDAQAVSPRGATGLMQLMPATADRYARGTESDVPAAVRMLDPRTNLQTGARMLADLSRRLGGIDVALAAWNAGEGRVRRHGGGVPPIAETRAHVHLVLELYWALLQDRHARSASSLRLADTAPPRPGADPP